MTKPSEDEILQRYIRGTFALIHYIPVYVMQLEVEGLYDPDMIHQMIKAMESNKESRHESSTRK